MPYNLAPIPPTDEAQGSSALPLARVKRIIMADEDIQTCSTNAAFLISIATELFVRYLAEQAHIVVRSEKKPRRGIMYKDVAAAVARADNLEFLSDIVPKTVSIKEVREKEKKGKAGEAGGTKIRLSVGQTTLDKTAGSNKQNAQEIRDSGDDTEPEEQADPDAMEVEEDLPGPQRSANRTKQMPSAHHW